MKRIAGLVLILSVVGSALILSGCSGPTGNELGDAVSKAYEQQTGRTDVNGAGANEVDDQSNESHRLMTQMLLSGAGKDPSLDSYTAIYLVDMKRDDGTEFKAVVADGEVVLPQNLE